MSTRMRAKVRVSDFKNRSETQETVIFNPVAKPNGYPADGSDEDNTFAKFSPSGRFELTIANPALIGQFEIGDTFYVDFVPVEPKAAEDDGA